MQTSSFVLREPEKVTKKVLLHVGAALASEFRKHLTVVTDLVAHLRMPRIVPPSTGK